MLRLVRWLHPDVDIRVDPHQFRFAAEGRDQALSPILHLRRVGTRLRVCAVGDVALLPRTSEDVRIELLNPASLPLTPWTREDALTAFLRYGITVVLARQIFVWPVVSLRGLASVAGAFSGRENEVLAKACRLAGAHEVLVC